MHLRARLICCLLLLTPTTADALTVRQASIHVNPKKTDAVRVSGTLETFTVGASDDVHVILDGVSYTVPAAALKRKKQKLTFHDRSKGPGVKSLSLDFAHAKFTVALADLVLGSVRSPATLELTAGASASCTRIPLATSAKHPPPDASSSDKERQRSRSFKLIKPISGESTSCALDGPVLDPAVLVVGDAPTVRVEVAASTSIDANSMVVRRADVAGVPQGNPLCTPVDDGNATHGDTHAGDGTYGCLLPVGTSAPTRFTIVATATAAGSILRSPPAVVQVAMPLTAEQLAAHRAIQAQAEQLWEANKATLGDTLAARLATVAALRLLPGIDDVTLSDEEGSIAIFFPTGVIGGLALTPRIKAPPATLTTAPASRSAVARDASPPGPPPDDAVLVGNRKVLVWYGASSLGIEPNSTEFESARDTFASSTCPRFDVASFDQDDATLEELDGMTSYGTVVLVTHGFVERRTASGHPMNAMRIENDYESVTERKDALQREEVYLSGGISPNFVRELAGQFDHAVMWGGFCWSGYDDATVLPFSQPSPTHILDSLVDAYVAKGVGAYFGFSRPVETGYARGLAATVFPALVHDLQTTTAVYDAAEPKVNPPFKQESGEFVKETLLAHFVYRPPNGAPLVYLKPAVTPKNPELDALGQTTLTVTVDGSQDCDLRYHWHNTGTAGHLSGGDDFDSTTATATYQALDVQQQHDTVTVDVIDAGGASPRTLFRLTDTVSIGCTKCAATTLQTRSTAEICAPAEACCGDHIDNDGDGKTDCDDPDCADDAACKPVLSGTPDGLGTLNVDDDLDVYVNGTQVYSDGVASSSATRPRIPLTAQKDDTLRFVVRDTYGGCAHLGPVYFVRGAQSALADPGFDLGCHQPAGNNGVVHDHSFMVPF